MPDFTVRPYGPEDLPALLGLARASLGTAPATPMTPEFWHWKHHANPFGPSYGLTAWDEGSGGPVGLRIFMHWRFYTPGNEVLRAVRAVDTATHPDFQRRGIFSTLTQQALADLAASGVDFIFNTPNARSLPGYLKLGWQVAAEWPLYVKPLRPARMLWRGLPRADLPSAAAGDIFGPPICNWADFRAAAGDRLEPFLQAAAAARPRAGLHTPRDAAYLDWRYGQHPHVAYGVYTETSGPRGPLTGLAVLRPNLRYRWQEAVLAELILADPHDAAVARRFLAGLAAAARGDYLIAHAAAATPERQALARAGFWLVPRRRLIFTVRPLQSGLPDLCTPSAWDLALGDLEIF